LIQLVQVNNDIGLVFKIYGFRLLGFINANKGYATNAPYKTKNVLDDFQHIFSPPKPGKLMVKKYL